MADPVEMGWLDRIVNVNFGQVYMYVLAVETTEGDPDDLSGDVVGTATVTAANAPQDQPAGLKVITQHKDPNSLLIPPQTLVSPPFFYIWGPSAGPPADETNYQTLGFFDQSIVGQYIFGRSIAAVAIGAAGIRANPDGTFKTEEDATNALAIGQAALHAYFESISPDHIDHFDLTVWMNMDGVTKSIPQGDLTIESLSVHTHVPGQSAASLIAEWLYSVPSAPFEFSVNVTAPGPNPLTEVSVRLYTTVKGKLTSLAQARATPADAEGSKAVLSTSHNYKVKVNPGKNPTVTVA